MTISKALESKIVRLHFVEKWRVHTIARQLNIHHTTVERVLSQVGVPKPERSVRTSIVDPYVPFIIETLKQFPKLTAARLYAMAQQRGYCGGPSHFRAHIAQLRPRPPTEAYLRLRTLPGEQAQVDWGHFDYVHISKAKRPLMAFVMVLSFSRQIFLRFYLNQRTDNFIRGHVAAFEALNGVPKKILYDNLKSAVLERHHDAIHFHPTLLALSAHYRFEPRPVAVARGNQKGRVERAIRYIRDNFFAARVWRDIDDLNDQATAWCNGPSAQRACPEHNELTVGEAFEQEQPRLLTLPDNPFPTDERVEVAVGKTPYVRFDLNDYSLPHTFVQRTATVVASLTHVRVLDGAHVVAQHTRSYAKGEQVEDPEHIEQLVHTKRRARRHRAQDRLVRAAPACTQLIELATERGHRPRTVVSLLATLLDEYGPSELQHAITEALAQNTPHPNAVRQVLEQRREQLHRPPPIALALHHNAKAEHIVVRTPSLARYDELNTPAHLDNHHTEPDSETTGDDVNHQEHDHDRHDP